MPSDTLEAEIKRLEAAGRRRLSKRDATRYNLHKNDLKRFAHYLGIEKLDDWQEKVLDSKSDRIILNCSRQSGKSTCTAIMAVHHAIFNPNSMVIVISRIEAQSLEVFKRMSNAAGTAVKSPTNSEASGILITVVICTHNRANFLQRAVESVLPQMTGGTELLIVDNASTDDTPGVAARLAAADPKVKVWREKELGLSVARNAALKKAQGQYVLFLDDDATAEPGWLAAYQRFLSAPPSGKIAVVGGAAFTIEYEIALPSWTDPLNPSAVYDRGHSPKRLPYLDCLLGCNIAYSRAAVIGGFTSGILSG